MVVREFSPSRLRKARNNRAFTQDDLAHELRKRGLKTNAGQIRRWETGSHMPRASVIPVLADALGVTLDDLYGVAEDEAEGRRVSQLISDIRATPELPLALRLRIEQEILEAAR